ncbi:MAG: peptidylprolyl isomerase [Acidobacteriota bacterium]|jgi:peptidyl-prolyl cis-trans isomerase C|nr:peptidylprolyl isomerase [Bryobacteraceae bacterium CoA2 C42]
MGLLINGEYVSDALIRQEMASLRPHYEAMMADMEPVAREVQLKDWSRENVIERVLLRQEAARRHPAIPPDQVNERLTSLLPPPGDPDSCEAGATRAGVDLEAMKIEVLSQIQLERLVQEIGDKAPKPKKQELLDFYQANRERFLQPPMLHASHIVKNVNDTVDEATAHAAIAAAEAELTAGQLFAEVADRHSDCAGQGGSLGWFPVGEMVEEFENALLTLQPGQTTPIFRSVFGFHIAQLHDRRPEGVRPFNDVRAEIEAALQAQSRERALENFVDKLKETAIVKSAKAPAAAPPAASV